MPKKNKASKLLPAPSPAVEIFDQPPQVAEGEISSSACAVAVIEEIPPSVPAVMDQPKLLTEEPVGEPVAEIIAAGSDPSLADVRELMAAIEAMLFASPEPIPIKRMAEALEGTGADTKAVREALHELIQSYDAQTGGLQILETSVGFQMATRERFAEIIGRLGSKRKRQVLSNATLETLAIIAYRQPVIRAVVETIRGVESSGTIRNLLDMGLIEITGYKEVIGRPPMYGTTAKFLRAFGLRGVKDLPSIRGLRERFAEEGVVLTTPQPVVENGLSTPSDVPVENANPSAEPEANGQSVDQAISSNDSLTLAAQELAERMEDAPNAETDNPEWFDDDDEPVAGPLA